MVSSPNVALGDVLAAERHLADRHLGEIALPGRDERVAQRRRRRPRPPCRRHDVHRSPGSGRTPGRRGGRPGPCRRRSGTPCIDVLHGSSVRMPSPSQLWASRAVPCSVAGRSASSSGRRACRRPAGPRCRRSPPGRTILDRGLGLRRTGRGGGRGPPPSSSRRLPRRARRSPGPARSCRFRPTAAAGVPVGDGARPAPAGHDAIECLVPARFLPIRADPAGHRPPDCASTLRVG